MFRFYRGFDISPQKDAAMLIDLKPIAKNLADRLAVLRGYL
ncbi:hypothetical protein FACS189460_4940 [Deltaproteobacteria bacterium]|nr:hypothetical protein FACS189460_4940 [Deltaproteobacteria bacterium]